MKDYSNKSDLYIKSDCKKSGSSKATQKINKQFFFSYSGSSMNPTLSEGDMLEVVPYGERSIKIGDVIFFQSPEDDYQVVHRVIQVSSKGIRTRGDNNSRADSYLLCSKDIAGHVAAAWRGQKRREIHGGKKGRLMAFMNYRRRTLDQKVSLLLHPLYRALSYKGILKHILPERLTPRVVSFKSQSSDRHRLLMGNHIIGVYESQNGSWNIKRPFRLFVDESILSWVGEINSGSPDIFGSKR